MKKFRYKLSQGFTLMEILVALLVLSIGLLGMAGMQVFALSSNYDAYLRTQATFFAYELVDKLAANRAESLSGGYDTSLSSIAGSIVNCQTVTANCSPNELAVFEVTQWKCALGSYQGNSVCNAPLNLTPTLPNGDGTVTRNGSQITVTVQWQGRTSTEIVSVVTEL